MVLVLMTLEERVWPKPRWKTYRAMIRWRDLGFRVITGKKWWRVSCSLRNQTKWIRWEQIVPRSLERLADDPECWRIRAALWWIRAQDSGEKSSRYSAHSLSVIPVGGVVSKNVQRGERGEVRIAHKGGKYYRVWC